jgi:uncharacterized pyridoxal phosphate-dependent enzyme
MGSVNQRNRRNFLAAAGASIVSLLPEKLFAARGVRPGGLLAKASSPPGTGNIYDELGVITVINGWGTITLIGGSLMPPEVVAAMEAASKHFVSIPELLDATGDRIAAMLKDLPPDHTATVTSGAAGAIMCGVSGVLTGENRELIQRLPDLTGMKSEVIFQKAHHEEYGYSQQILASGVKIIEVEYPDDVRRAVSQRTALLYFANYANPAGRIKVDAWAKLAKELGVPCFNDCAADTPPVAHLTAYNKMGYDLVAWSGGKGIRGPQCAGMLIGRKDLVRAARLNAAPFDPTLGRGLKVGKEEIVGMWKAVEVYLRQDSKTESDEWWNRLEYISKQLRKVQGVTTAFYVPPIANHVPTMRIDWDPRKFSLTTAQALEFLKNGKPSVLLQDQDDGVSLAMNSFMLRSGDDRMIASRLNQMFQAHRA